MLYEILNEHSTCPVKGDVIDASSPSDAIAKFGQLYDLADTSTCQVISGPWTQNGWDGEIPGMKYREAGSAGPPVYPRRVGHGGNSNIGGGTVGGK
jgi:hypothetical protein